VTPHILHAAGDTAARLPLLLALRARGFEVSATGSGDSAPFDAAGVPYRCVPLHRGLAPFADFGTLRGLRAACRALRPDVVHGFETKPAIYAPLAAARAGVPVRVRTVTGLGWTWSVDSAKARTLRPTVAALHKRASAASARTFFQNPEDCADFVGLGLVDEARAALVPGSGVDVAALDAAVPGPAPLAALRAELSPRGAPIVVFAGRLLVAKGVPVFLQAARALLQAGVVARFVLVGPRDGAGAPAVNEALLDEYRDQVLVLGPRADLPALLAASDLFVLPTAYREGLPRTLLEAAALGLPLVATDAPGCREILRDGWNGLRVPVGDAAALAKAIAALLADAPLRALMAERSRERVLREFTLDRVADAYAAHYRELLAMAADGASWAEADA